MEPELNSLQERLKYARNKLNLTQLEVANRAGIKQPSYSSLETNENNGSSKYLPEIAKVLGVDLYWLVSGGSAPPLPNIQDQLTSIPIIHPEWSQNKNEVFLDNILRYEQISTNILKSIKLNIANVKFVEMWNSSMAPFFERG